MKKNLLYSAVAFVLFCVTAEIALRLFFWATSAVNPSPLQFENKLGWAPPAFSKNISRPKGYDQWVSVTTVRDGFRRFDDPKATRIKVWVIGDSHTQAAQASDGRTYFDYIAKNADVEMFAFGCGGYGTLQEYMILDRFLDEIRPDVILWQFSMNDIVNNDYEIESRSRVNNNRNVRPYWRGGRIEWLYPQNVGLVPAWLTRTSLLARFIIVKWNLAFPGKATIEDDLKPGDPMLKRSEETTIALLKMAKQRVGRIPMVAFLADDGWDVADKNFERISAAADVTFLPGVPDLIREAKKRGLKVDGMPYDSHWNSLGHQVVGEYLYKRVFAKRSAGGAQEGSYAVRK